MHEQIAFVTMATRVLQLLKWAFLCIALSAYSAQNFKAGLQIVISQLFDSYRD